MLGGVSVPGDDVNLLVLALLVFHLERTTVGGYDLHLQLAVGAVEFAVGGMIGQRILIADVVGNILKVLAILSLKSRKVSAAAGDGCEGAHFVVGLQVIHFAGVNAHAAPSLTQYPSDLSHADRENGHIFRILDLLGDLIQRELAEAVESGGDENDVFLAFNSIQAIQGIVQSIEQVSLSESGNAQLVQGPIDRVLVLSEIHQNVRLHVVIADRDPVVFRERVGKG